MWYCSFFCPITLLIFIPPFGVSYIYVNWRIKKFLSAQERANYGCLGCNFADKNVQLFANEIDEYLKMLWILFWKRHLICWIILKHNSVETLVMMIRTIYKTVIISWKVDIQFFYSINITGIKFIIRNTKLVYKVGI